MDGLRAGWQTATQDFWQTWLIAFLFFVMTMVASLPGMIPLVGLLWAAAVGFVVGPQLQAGLVYAVRRKVDGETPGFEDLFEGFKQRFVASLITVLPMIAVVIVFMVLFLGVGLLAGGMGALSSADNSQTGLSVLSTVLMVPLMLAYVAAMLFAMVVIWFAFVAMWEGEETGRAALSAGMRLVRANLVPSILLALMAVAVIVACSIAGVLALCVGYLVAMPFAVLWMTATFIHLYRSWSATP
jgi:hypothetical protein